MTQPQLQPQLFKDITTCELIDDNDVDNIDNNEYNIDDVNDNDDDDSSGWKMIDKSGRV